MGNNVCPQCGAPLDPGASQCKYCGEKIIRENNNYQNQQSYDFRQQEQLVYEQAQPVYQQAVYTNAQNGINPSWPVRSRVVAGILAILVGMLGIHHFYLGHTKKGIIYLLFFWTYIPAVIGFIEGIIYLCSSDYNFQIKNKVRIK